MPEITAKIYNLEGQDIGKQTLPAKLFGVPIKAEVVQQVVVAQEANSRQSLAHTKTRGEVRGGGRKPWKQKGTGRARHGSIRSPLWSGGGITFGPRSNRNFTKSVNKKLRRKALAMVLSDKVKNEKLLVIDKLEISQPKTKLLFQTLNKLPVKGKKTAIITDGHYATVIRAARNLPKASTIAYNSLNVLDLLKCEFIILPQALIDKVVKTYSN